MCFFIVGGISKGSSSIAGMAAFPPLMAGDLRNILGLKVAAEAFLEVTAEPPEILTSGNDDDVGFREDIVEFEDGGNNKGVSGRSNGDANANAGDVTL